MKLQTSSGSELQTGGGYLSEPGTFHFSVDSVRVGMSTKDKPIDGNTLHLTCLAGTVPDCSEKKLDIVLWNLDTSKSEKAQEMTTRQLTAFYLAVNTLQPAQLGQDVDIDEESPAGHQFIAKLMRSQKMDDNGEWVDDPKGNLKFHYDDIWHVDDPDCAEFPKLEIALEFIPKELRHGREFFNYKPKNKRQAAADAPKTAGPGSFDVNSL